MVLNTEIVANIIISESFSIGYPFSFILKQVGFARLLQIIYIFSFWLIIYYLRIEF